MFSLLVDFKIRIPNNFHQSSPESTSKSIRNSIAKQIRKLLEEFTTFDQVLELANQVSFSTNKIKLTLLDGAMEEEKEQYAIELVVSTTQTPKVKGDFSFENYGHALPVRVDLEIFSRNSGRLAEIEGYSSAKSQIKSNRHDVMVYMINKRKKMGSLRLFDLATIMADIYLNNMVEHFVLNNQDLYEYKLGERLLEKNTLYQNDVNISNKLIVPVQEESQNIFMNALKKYNMINDDVVIEPDERFDTFGEYSVLKFNEDKSQLATMSKFVYYQMLIEMVKQINYVKDKVERAIKETSDYARSFQTKKHINKSTQAAMENSVFLSKYGYVELDNDVALEKYFELEKEFQALTTQVYIPKCDNHSFRIKKLGHHRAAGLYYPAPVRATLFDLDYPSAYCHELGHQIDNVLAKGRKLLSEEIEFIRVRELYRELVNEKVESLPNSHPFKAAWEGKTKYNSSYYLLPTEIFARSYELYLHHKGIKTSFLKASYELEPEYPKQERFIKAINEYFDKLFSAYTPDTVDVIEETEKSIVSKASTQPVIAEFKQSAAPKKVAEKKPSEFKLEGPIETEQLSLF